MSKLADMQEISPVKAIIAAGSGTGKTGSLWSLAAAGFKLKIYDCDRGNNVLASILRKHAPAAIANVEANVFTNKLIPQKGGGYPKPAPGDPGAWRRYLDAQNNWPDDPTTGPNTWGPDTVMVIDSLTLLGRHALLEAQKINNTLGRRPEWTDYGTAQAQLEFNFAQLYGEHVRCHIIWLTHISIQNDKDGNYVGSFPSSVGKALNDVIPRYVNNILTIKMSGMGGTKAKRHLSIKPTNNQIATKTENLDVKEEYLLADGFEPKPGLAEFFADLGWKGPGA